MKEKLETKLKDIKKEVLENDEKQAKLYDLLNNATLQVEEIQQKLEKLQLENQASNNEIKKLEIVKEYLEEVEEGTENE